jgi:hypothetical protein
MWGKNTAENHPPNPRPWETPKNPVFWPLFGLVLWRVWVVLVLFGCCFDSFLGILCLEDA